MRIKKTKQKKPQNNNNNNITWRPCLDIPRLPEDSSDWSRLLRRRQVLDNDQFSLVGVTGVRNSLWRELHQQWHEFAGKWFTCRWHMTYTGVKRMSTRWKDTPSFLRTCDSLGTSESWVAKGDDQQRWKGVHGSLWLARGARGVRFLQCGNM